MDIRPTRSRAGTKRRMSARKIPGRSKPYPGGKALARIQLFEAQRGIDMTEVQKETLVRPAPPRTARARASKNKSSTGVARRRTRYLNAFRQKRRMTAPVSGLKRWREIGPHSIPKGQTYGSGGNDRPPVSGRISAVVVDPADSNRILICAAGGGIWESPDRGTTWKPLTDFQPTLSMGALAFAPSDPRRVYAGTGDGDTYSQLGVGLLRSDDGGATWQLLAASVFEGTGFYAIAVEPSDPDRLVAGTWAGLYTSSNGGSTWTRRRSKLTWDLSVHPSGNGEVFAACEDGLYQSANGGASWTKVSLSGFSLQDEIDRLEVCHAPSKGAIVYAFASVNGRGRLWRRSTPSGNFTEQALTNRLKTGQAWYDWCCGVPYDDPDTLYVGAIEVFKGKRISSSNWRWTNISSRSSGDSIHPDQHHLTFVESEPAAVYIGNDGGLFRSPDRGKSWDALNKGLGITEFEYLAQHPTNLRWLLGGTQDNGTLSMRGGLVWDQVASGDGGDCGVNDSSPKTCYHTYYSMGFEVSEKEGKWSTWRYCDPGLPQGYESLFYPPLEVNGNLVVQAGESLIITRDKGASWDEVALPVEGKQEVASAVAIPNKNSIFVGTKTGRLYIASRNSGKWFLQWELARPRPGFISDIHVDPDDTDLIWVTFSTVGGSHAYYSDDGGASWQNRSSCLPNISLSAVAVDPDDTDVVFVGGDNGVYRSDDRGATWADFSYGLPNALVGDLLFHAKRRLLRAATRNRGVWEIDV